MTPQPFVEIPLGFLFPANYLPFICNEFRLFLPLAFTGESSLVLLLSVGYWMGYIAIHRKVGVYV